MTKSKRPPAASPLRFTLGRDDFSVGNEFDTSIELESLTFTRNADKKELSLKDVPPELYSETAYTVEAAIAALR